jgi:hypothetical protein
MALAQQPTGLLIPLYSYPAHIHQNPTYNRLIVLKRQYPTVPCCVIVNPASGPGEALDENYRKAIDRLLGAGIYVLGYVSTEYGNRDAARVLADFEQWRRLYPHVQGMFLDEMSNAVDPAMVAKYADYTRQAHAAGYWPVFANPGAETPEPYFQAPAADVIVIHEAKEAPTQAKLHGDYFGGYSDYPPHTRGVLLYGRDEWNQADFDLIREYVRWVYVTEGKFEQPTDNPWDGLSRHTEQMSEQLARPSTSFRTRYPERKTCDSLSSTYQQ